MVLMQPVCRAALGKHNWVFGGSWKGGLQMGAVANDYQPTKAKCRNQIMHLQVFIAICHFLWHFYDSLESTDLWQIGIFNQNKTKKHTTPEFGELCSKGSPGCWPHDQSSGPCGFAPLGARLLPKPATDRQWGTLQETSMTLLVSRHRNVFELFILHNICFMKTRSRHFFWPEYDVQ